MSLRVAIQNPVVGKEEGSYEFLWYVEPYFNKIYQEVSKKINNVLYFYRDRAVRNVEWSELSIISNVSFYCGVGHGDFDLFTSYKLDRIFWIDMEQENFNMSVLRGSIMLILSCRTATQLGSWIVQRGVWSYIGWREDFILPVIIGER